MFPQLAMQKYHKREVLITKPFYTGCGQRMFLTIWLSNYWTSHVIFILLIVPKTHAKVKDNALTGHKTKTSNHN